MKNIPFKIKYLTKKCGFLPIISEDQSCRWPLLNATEPKGLLTKPAWNRIHRGRCVAGGTRENKILNSGIFQNFLVMLPVQVVFLNFVVESLAGYT